jgi:mono/diheme cytochrome c family protein
MANDLLLALFDDVARVMEAVKNVRDLGLPDANVTVMSSVPYEAQMLDRPQPHNPMPRVALLGAILGLITAVVLLLATFLLYPLVQGGQPIVPLPPSLIIVLEITMLGTMWATFFGFLAVNRLPTFGAPLYDARITLGKIGLLVRPKEAEVREVESALREAGAVDVRLVVAREGTKGRVRVRAAVTGVVLLLAVGLSLLFFYDVIRIPFPTNMAHQASVAYEQGPRLAAPAAAVPIDGPVLIANQPATQPLPADDASLQRGQVLFGIDCAVCHGSDGAGKGNISGFFSPPPADLTSDRVQNLPQDVIFLVITQGQGPMPSLAENLSVVERWDVVNWVQSLGQ